MKMRILKSHPLLKLLNSYPELSQFKKNNVLYFALGVTMYLLSTVGKVFIYTFEFIGLYISSPPKPYGFESLPIHSSTLEVVQVSLQPGMLDVCADNISKDLSKFLFVDCPEKLTNLMTSKAGVDSTPRPNLFDHYCYEGYIALKNTVVPSTITAGTAVSNAAISAGIAYMPHIVNSVYPIPAGEYSVGNSLIMLVGMVGQDLGVFTYTFGLNIGGGDGLVLSHRVYSPFSHFVSVATIQFFSNYIELNPDRFKDYTVQFGYKPWLLISGFYFFRWLIPKVLANL